MSARKTVVLRARSQEVPASSRMAAMFLMTTAFFIFEGLG
jgi:hypothetical protein